MMAVIAFLPLSISAQTYYVSNSGDDGNPGSLRKPWASLEKVQSSVKKGDVVYLARGSKWVSQLNIPADNITIDAYGNGEPPIIEGDAKYFSIAIKGKSNITIRNLALINARNDCIRVEQEKAALQGIRIESNRIVGCGHDGIDVSASDINIQDNKLPYDIQINNNDISDCGNAAVQIRAQADIGVNRVASNRIDNVGLKYATNAISLGYVHKLIVENNVITNTRSTEIDGSGITADYLKYGNRHGTGTIIRNNVVVCPTPPANDIQAGIAIWHQPDVQVYGNSVLNCNEGIRVSGKVSSGYDIHHNEIAGALKRGVSFTSQAGRGRLEYNSIIGVNNESAGISINKGSTMPELSENVVTRFSSTIQNNN